MSQGPGAGAVRWNLRDFDGGSVGIGIEVVPGAGVRGYSLFVDGMPAVMNSGHRGRATCAGRSGDGSRHTLLYNFNGAAGSTLEIVLRCAGRPLCRFDAAPIATGGPPWGAGRVMFSL